MVDSFTVTTFNANSVRVRQPQILAWLDAHKPDVLCIQETKVQDKDFPAQPFVDAGYHVVFRGQKSYSGVAILSLEEPQDVASGLDDGGEPDHPRMLKAVVRGVPIVNTYVPQGRAIDRPEFQYKQEWFGRLRAYFDRHFSATEPLIWLGDLNVAPEEIDVHDPKRVAKHVDFHPDARAALKEAMTWGFVDVVRKHHPDEAELYSYWDLRIPKAVERKVGWRIDLILTTEVLAAKSLGAWIDVDARLAERPSDHTFVTAEFAL